MHEDPYERRDALPDGLAHRRGAGINPGNRFEPTRVHIDGDAMDRRRQDRIDEGGSPDDPVRVPLEIFADHTRRLINRVDRTSDVPFDWTVNPYRGCEHGCVYCFARPFHEYLGFSSGLDFETKLVVKHDAPRLLRDELSNPNWQGEPIVMSAITDVYQPLEKKLQITRQCLEIMSDCGQPVSTMTKGALVLRDIDLWEKLGKINAGRVIVTLVTLDDVLAKKLEPRAAAPARRLHVIRELVKAGVPVGVNIAPVIPGLTDKEIPRLLEAIADAGARRVAWVLLRLPYQLKDIFLDWLARELPDRAGHVESLIRQAHGGKLYRAGRRGSDKVAVDHDGQGARRKIIRSGMGASAGGKAMGNVRRGVGGNVGGNVGGVASMFDVFTRKYGLNRDVRPLSRKTFRRPMRGGQMSLF